MALSLFNHHNQYSISTHELLKCPILSPYAQRHFELSDVEKVTSVKWGHRIIGIIESIPLVGLIASLIERIVAIVYKWLKPAKENASIQPLPTKKHFPVKKISQGCLFDRIDGDPIRNISRFLSRKDAISLLQINGKQADNIWKGQLDKLKVKLVKGQKPIDRMKEVVGAKCLIKFCRCMQTSEYKDKMLKIDQCKELNLIQKADDLRAWLKDKIVLTESNLRVEDYSAELTTNKLKKIPPEIKLFKFLEKLMISAHWLEKLPKEIEELQQLKELIISTPRLKKIPDYVFNLKNLTTLWIDYDCDTIPKEVARLENLKLLCLGKKIVNIPDEVRQMKDLTIRVIPNS